MILLDDELFRILVSRMDEQGCAEWSRYTGRVKEDGTMTVWAWVDNEPRKIGNRAVPKP